MIIIIRVMSVRLPHQRPVDHRCLPLLDYGSTKVTFTYLFPQASLPPSVHYIFFLFNVFSPVFTHKSSLSVDAIYWHQSYDYQTMDHDILLLKLAHPVTLNKFVNPIALPTACPKAGDVCDV